MHMAGKNSAIDLLAEILNASDLSTNTLSKTKSPAKAREALDKWIASVNISFDDIDDEVRRGAYQKNQREFYVCSFSVDEPELYVGKVIVQDGKLIGESSSISG